MATDWIRYTRTETGRGAPYLSVSLSCGDAKVDRKLFLVDTGSELCFAPLHYAQDLCNLSVIPEEDTRCFSLSNARLTGKPVDVVIGCRGFAPIKERIFFRDTRIAVLGQSRFLEVVGALFLNEPIADGMGRFKLIPRSAFRPVKNA